MIEIEQLTKRFGSATAVDHLSFTIAPGEVLGFLGPNGAGKSTTMKMLTGFLQPDSGSAKIFSHDVVRDPLAVKRLVGYLPEGAPSYGDMTVQQFLRFIAEVRGFKGAGQSERVAMAVELLDLDSVLLKPIDTLSKGFNRRVGLAQAILHDPRVLILDEPTDGLDPNQKQQVRDLIRNLAKDKIVIISTHILEEVSAVCSRAIIISHGKIVADGTPAKLQAQSRYFQAITLRVDGELPVVESLSALEGVREVQADRESPYTFTVFPEPGKNVFATVSAYLQQQQWPVSEFHIDSGRLDDVFRRATGGQP